MLEINAWAVLDKVFGEGAFSPDEVNCGRQPELDIAKGFAIVFMVWVHTLETFGSETGLGYELVENFLGGPFAAPVFMACMGIGMRYTRHASARDFAHRGVSLLATGLALNVFRYVLPLLAAYALTGEAALLNTFAFLYGVDILQFAGLAFLFVALAKWIGWSERALTACAVAAALLGAALKWRSVGHMVADQLLGYLIADANAETYFPFLNWICFPVFGYLLGGLLRHCADKRTFYLHVAPACGALGLGYLVTAYELGFGMYGEDGYYYHLGPVDALFVCLLVVGILGACFALSRLGDRLPLRMLADMSAHINTVYCIQWTIIGSSGILLFWLLPDEGLPFPAVTAVAAAICTVSALLARWYAGHRLLSARFARIALAVVVAATMVASAVGQVHADTSAWDDEGREYATTDTEITS